MTTPMSDSVRVAQALYSEFARREAGNNPHHRSLRFDHLPATEQRWWITRAGLLIQNPRGYPRWERDIAREATSGRK